MVRSTAQESTILFQQPLQQARQQNKREALALSSQHTKRVCNSKALLLLFSLILLLSSLSQVEARSLPTRLQSSQRRSGDYALRDAQLPQSNSQQGAEGSLAWFGRRGPALRDSTDRGDSSTFPAVRPLKSNVAVSNHREETQSPETVRTPVSHQTISINTSSEHSIPTSRWGHASVYLPSHDVVLFVGGQTSKDGNITNDVFALDVSELHSSSNQTSSSSSNKWTQLSSHGLPAHAFAASVMESKANGTNDLWLVGGVTQDCNTNAPAYVWSAPHGNLTRSKWTNVTLENAPMRRRGASAVEIATSSSFMVVGGVADDSVCHNANALSNATEAKVYTGVDVWLLGRNNTSARSDVEIQSLAIDSRLESMPLFNYASVVLPGNSTTSSGISDRVVLIGGRDANGNLTKLDQIWAMDLSTGGWGQLNTTGTVPSGREGLSAVLARDSRIIVHGGYVSDPARPSSETYVLDLSHSPAVWSKANLSAQSGTPPARAYHSAVMAGDTMVVAFGQEGLVSRNTSARAEHDSHAQVQFLDISAGPEGWTWSDSMSTIAALHHAAATKPTSPIAHSTDNSSNQSIKTGEDSDTSVSAPSTTDHTVNPTGTQAPSNTQSEGHATESSLVTPIPSSATQGDADADADADAVVQTVGVPAPIPTPSPSHAAAPAPSNAAGPSTSSGPTASQKGAIAGSLLGAAAVVAAIGGLYAYRKRKEAGAQAAGEIDIESKENWNGEARGPPVSNLWLHQPTVWASAAGKSIRRAASGASNWRRNERQSPYTTPPRGTFQVLRGRRESRIKGSQLPHHVRSPLALPLAEPEQHHSAAEAYLTVPRSRSASSESLASHISYPYLAAMHHLNLPSPTSDSNAARIPVSGHAYAPSPEMYLASPATLSLSPGDAVILTSDGQVFTNPHTDATTDTTSIIAHDGLSEISHPPPVRTRDSFLSINIQPNPKSPSIPLSEKLAHQSRNRSSIHVAKKTSLRIANNS